MNGLQFVLGHIRREFDRARWWTLVHTRTSR
jgi:hypothetical protein